MLLVSHYARMLLWVPTVVCLDLGIVDTSDACVQLPESASVGEHYTPHIHDLV